MKRYAIISLVVLLGISPLFGLITHNQGGLETEIRQQMNDTSSDTSLQRWSETVLDARINDAQTDIDERVRPVRKNAVISTTIGISTYALPTDWLDTNRVVYDTDGSSTTTKYVPIQYKTLLQMDRDSSGWESTSSGTPNAYFYDADYIYVYPAPGLKYCGDYGSLKIWYSVYSATMSADTDVPFNGYRNLYQYHKIIVWYVCALCAHDEGNSGAEQFYWAKYMADIKEMQDQINNRNDRTNGQGIQR